MFWGKLLFVDFTPFLEVSIDAAFSKLNGAPLLRLSDHVGLWPADVLKLPLFHPGSPLIRRFGFYHDAIFETGMVPILIRKTR